MYRAKIQERNDGWWITNLPLSEDCGPYNSIEEATEDMKGILRFIENCDDYEFIMGMPEIKKPEPPPGRFRRK